MKNESHIPYLASEITIIDDGQFRFPVLTVELGAWTEKHGQPTPANYEQFCDDVPRVDPDIYVGSDELVEICRTLEEAGSPVKAV